ncbi:MAG: succinate dehydrogenase cytochrome b subunit [Geobacter sp.]|nr:succinate dehydrogenase cytochrome b subunit [Geobacter sp.]
MQILKSAVGRKVLMAITGQSMVLFAVVHMLGNSSIFVGPDGINAYAKHLHDLGALVWLFRAGLFALAAIHIFYAIQLTLENSAANPAGYAVKKQIKATFASSTMIWTGVVIMAFIVYHLLHFTARLTPGVVQGVDALGRFDVFTMVVSAFKNFGTSAIYVIAMAALFLHLSHGIQSFFQTMGWNTDKTQCTISAIGKAVAFILLAGYVVIPLSILASALIK